MISKKNLQNVLDQVYQEVSAFITQKDFSKRDFCDPSTEAQWHARIPSLARFIFNLTGAKIQNFRQLPAPNYSSWLFTSSNEENAIYLDQRQMESWFRQTGMPVEAQKIRSILHEVGHLQINPRLRLGKVQSFADPATPEEEEEAWVYAGAFLAILIGDFSLDSRRSKSNVDDTPKLCM